MSKRVIIERVEIGTHSDQKPDHNNRLLHDSPAVQKAEVVPGILNKQTNIDQEQVRVSKERETVVRSKNDSNQEIGTWQETFERGLKKYGIVNADGEIQEDVLVPASFSFIRKWGLIASLGAIGVHTLIYEPLNRIQFIIQNQAMSLQIPKEQHYPTMKECFKGVIKNEGGIAALYRGSMIKVMYHSSFAAFFILGA